MTVAPSAWRKPGFDEFVLIPAPNAMSRLQAVATGQADLVANIPSELVPDAEAAGLTIHRIATAMVSSFTFRTVDNPDSPVHDVRVRQAMNYAINKDLMGILVGGLSPQAGQGAPSFVHGHNLTIAPYPYDPDRARALLADAGYANGLDISLTVSATDQTLALLAQQVAQDVAAVGINMELVQTNGQQWLQQYTLSSFETDLFNLTWNSAPLIDASRPMIYTSCLRSKPFFCEESLVPLIEKIQVELDPDKRLSMLQDAQARIHELAPAIFLFESVVPAASGPRLKKVPWRLLVPAYDLMEVVAE
jgi:peptide/nickel transport system substrate-binding protein